MKPVSPSLLVLALAACGSGGSLMTAPGVSGPRPTVQGRSAPRGMPPGGPSPTAATGVIGGSVVDAGSGVPLLLVTVVATSPALQGQQSEFTDAAGNYFLANLPPGKYNLLFIYGDAKIRRDGVEVRANRATAVGASLDTQATGEVITIKEKSPTLDSGSTKQGITITQDMMRNTPGPGRTWSGALGSAAGRQGDTYGTGFSGSTSVEGAVVYEGSAPAAARPLPPPARSDELWIIARADRRAAPPADDGMGSGELRATPPGKDQEVVLPLEHTDVRARIVGYVASVEVQQRWQNPFKQKIEATYVFPLPANAAVTDFLMVIGDRKIRGVVRDRAEAEELYAEARSDGYTAALLTEERPNIFSQRVANLEPGKSIDVALTYFNTLPYEDGGYTFAFPMVVGPRFNPPGSTTPHIEYLQPEQKSAHNLSLAVDLDAGLPVELLASPTHAIDVASPTLHSRHVTLREGATLPNKDFVLRWTVAGVAARPAFFLDGKTFALVLEPPADLAKVPRAPMEMVFVLDCSGSMNGKPIASAKRAVARVLDKLGPDDTFQIIRFSDRASALGERPIPATRDNVQRARDYLVSLEGEGGTTMLTGIEAALDFPRDPSRLRLVSFLTDGYIGNEAEILAAVHKKLGDARLFSFGVGSSVNRYLLEQLAAVGRGAVAFVGLGDDADSERAVDAFYERISHPALADIRVDWNGLAPEDVYPKVMPDLLVGRPVVVIGRMRGALPAKLRVAGKVGGREVAYDVPIDPTTLTPHPALTKLWARASIADLEDRAVVASNPQKLQAQIKDVALQHGLMSPFTAFIAVDAATKTAGSAAVTVPVAVPLPEGVRMGGQ